VLVDEDGAPRGPRRLAVWERPLLDAVTGARPSAVSETAALLAALVREVREEAGVEPLDVAPLGCFADSERADAFYVATAWRGEPRNSDPHEHSELRWVGLYEASERELPPNTRRALARLIEVVTGGTERAGRKADQSRRRRV
jgi:8-oxo-dGTP pyrophosphatase MutT (NUDIX family)